MAGEDRNINQTLLAQVFGRTLENRGRFERLDLRAVTSAVTMLDQAVRLAREHPEAFFSGFPATPTPGSDEPAIGGAQETRERSRPPAGQLDGLLDFLKAQKEYWSARDDTAQEGIKYEVPHWSTLRRSGRWNLDIQLDPPPGPEDAVEFFNPRTGEKLGDMTAMPLGHFIGSVGPESGVGSGDSIEVRVNDVPVQTMPLS